MAVSAHHAAIGMIFPPFLDHLRYSVSAIGTLASMGPILALAARIPSGLFNAAGDLGAILGPSLGGWVASFTGVRDLFIVGPLFIIAAFFLTLWGCRFVGREK
jgi:predicted MFS family arabinose efflux permease